MITRRHLLSAIVLGTTVVGCSSSPDPDASPLPTPDGADVAPDSDGATEEFPDAPTDDLSAEAAADHAERTLMAFWDTNQSQQGWYDGLSTLMTPAGAEPYQYTLVENVIPGTVTDTPDVTFEDAGNTAIVTVPSDLGAWTLTLYRYDEGWLTESISFPEEG